jgi:hypothetical protein
MQFTSTTIVLTVAYFLVASITTFDIRLIQAKKNGTLPPDEPGLPAWIGIFGWLEWGIFAWLLVMNWKYALLLLAVKFVLKVLPVLEIIGNVLMRPFRPSEVVSEFIEKPYFEKYKGITEPGIVQRLLEQYKRGPTVYEPIRKQLSLEEQKGLYSMIDNSSLPPQDRIESIVGLMMTLDGVTPSESISEKLSQIFGKDFTAELEKKRRPITGDKVVT